MSESGHPTTPTRPVRLRGASDLASPPNMRGRLHRTPSSTYLPRSGVTTELSPINAQISPPHGSMSNRNNYATPSAPRPLPGATGGSRAAYGTGLPRPIPIGAERIPTGAGSSAQHLLDGWTERELLQRNAVHRIPKRHTPTSYQATPPDPFLEEQMALATAQHRAVRRDEAAAAERAERRKREDAQIQFEMSMRGRQPAARPIGGGGTGRSHTPVYTIPRFTRPPNAPLLPTPLPPPQRASNATKFTAGFNLPQTTHVREPSPFRGMSSSSYLEATMQRGPSPAFGRRPASPLPFGGSSFGAPRPQSSSYRSQSPAFGPTNGSSQRLSSRDYRGGPQRSQTPRARSRDPYATPHGGGNLHGSSMDPLGDWSMPDIQNMSNEEFNAYIARSAGATMDAHDRRAKR
ncbi:hypothetical protein P7C70_g6851, partial [Phenoliferia sp. Uapishka_3]